MTQGLSMMIAGPMGVKGAIPRAAVSGTADSSWELVTSEALGAAAVEGSGSRIQPARTSTRAWWVRPVAARSGAAFRVGSVTCGLAASGV